MINLQALIANRKNTPLDRLTESIDPIIRECSDMDPLLRQDYTRSLIPRILEDSALLRMAMFNDPGDLGLMSKYYYLSHEISFLLAVFAGSELQIALAKERDSLDLVANEIKYIWMMCVPQ